MAERYWCCPKCRQVVLQQDGDETPPPLEGCTKKSARFPGRRSGYYHKWMSIDVSLLKGRIFELNWVCRKCDKTVPGKNIPDKAGCNGQKGTGSVIPGKLSHDWSRWAVPILLQPVETSESGGGDEKIDQNEPNWKCRKCLTIQKAPVPPPAAGCTVGGFHNWFLLKGGVEAIL